MSKESISTIYETLNLYSEQANKNFNRLVEQKAEISKVYQEQTKIIDSILTEIVKEQIEDFDIDKITKIDKNIGIKLKMLIQKNDNIKKTNPSIINNITNEITKIETAKKEQIHDRNDTNTLMQELNNQIQKLESKFAGDKIPENAKDLQRMAEQKNWTLENVSFWTKFISLDYQEWKNLTIALRKNGYVSFSIYEQNKNENTQQTLKLKQKYTDLNKKLNEISINLNHLDHKTETLKEERKRKIKETETVEKNTENFKTEIIQELKTKILEDIDKALCNKETGASIGKDPNFTKILDALAKQEYAQTVLSSIEKQLGQANVIKTKLEKPVDKLYNKRHKKDKISFDLSKFNELSNYLDNEAKRLYKQTHSITEQTRILRGYSSNIHRSAAPQINYYNTSSNFGIMDYYLYHYMYTSLLQDDLQSMHGILKHADTLNINEINQYLNTETNAHNNLNLITQDNNVDIPSFDTPQVDIPSFDTPQVDIPSFDTPQVDIPSFDTPQVDIPSFDIPQVDIPSFDIPDLDTQKSSWSDSSSSSSWSDSSSSSSWSDSSSSSSWSDSSSSSSWSD